MKSTFIFTLSLCLIVFVSCDSSSKSKDKTKNTDQTSLKSITIPLKTKGQWQVLEFSSIPPNKVTFSSKGLTIAVDQSASPLVFPLNTAKHIQKVEVEGHVDKLVSIQSPQKQGDKGFDDFNLRVGLVVLGSKTLSFFEKAISPEWVLTLFNLAPKGKGVSYIYFLNATISSQLQGRSRTHPLTEYIKENNAWLMNKKGSFSYSYEFKKSQHIGAIWISVDGDDTKSKFTTHIDKLILN